MTWTHTLGPITRSQSYLDSLVCKVAYVSDSGGLAHNWTHTQPSAAALAADIDAYTARLNATDADQATIAAAPVPKTASDLAALVAPPVIQPTPPDPAVVELNTAVQTITQAAPVNQELRAAGQTPIDLTAALGVVSAADPATALPILAAFTTAQATVGGVSPAQPAQKVGG